MNEAARPLACRFGRHDPGTLPRWNEGYYFARCRRCGADLVRTIYGRWQEPKGFRVVWSHVRPEGVPSPAVLADGRSALGPVPASARIPAEPVSYVPDFMDDPATDTSWRRHLPSGAERSETRAASKSDAQPAGADFARLIPPLRTGPAGADRARRPAGRAAFALFIFALLVLVIMVISRNSGAGAVARDTAPQPIMFVSDGMTSCRAGASFEAAHVRYLVRGDAVRLIGRTGGWAAISYGGQQCWVPLGLLSDETVG